MAQARGSWLSRLERRLMVLFGPAEVHGIDSRRPEPPPGGASAPPPPAVAPAPDVVRGEVVRTDRPAGSDAPVHDDHPGTGGR